ncbi:MAG: LysR substrate-binding domain-containing protein [Pseudomonadota bacterium]
MLEQQSLPPLNWLRAFECSARHLSFTAAAGELSLTQSAVSQHVRSLELRLGTTLFVRKARGLALTNAGRKLLPAVSGPLSELAQAAAMFRPGRTKNSLRISCNWAFSSTWLSPRLGQFAAQYPGTEIQIVSTLWPDDNLPADFDVEIRYGAKELVGDGAELLLADQIFPICTRQRAMGIQTHKDLYPQPLIQAVGSTDNWQTWALNLELPPPPAITFSVDSYALSIELAHAGAGIALVSGLVAEQSLLEGSLVKPLELTTPAKDNHYIAVRDTHDNNELSIRFVDWIHEELTP